MLDSYISSQPILYKMIVNSINKDRISHAYLVETNYNSFGLDFALSIAKFLLCPLKQTKNDCCVNCTQCKRIDENNFSELRMLKTETLQIKKEQIISLQKEFNLKSVESKIKVYIIQEAEKLNESSSAALLKFLEEPEENIVAILVTPNKNLLLNTIVSRCQIISMRKNNINDGTIEENFSNLMLIKDMEKNQFIESKEVKVKTQVVIDFIKVVENKGIESLLDINKDWCRVFTSKEDYLFAFNYLIVLYKEAIEIKLKKQSHNLLQEIIEKNTVEKLCKKLEIILEYKEKIKYNLNLNMLMDRFIIDMEGLI